MALQQTLGLPLTDNFPVNIQVRIHSRGRDYLAYIQVDGSDWYSFGIPLTPDDMQKLNAELQQAIEQIASTFERATPHEAECLAAITKLARKGNAAFNKIFAKGVARDVVREALQIGSTIQVTSEEFFLPWELLYDGPLDSQMDACYFWGIRYIISRTLVREARPGDFMPPTISSRPRVGLIACQELEYVVEKEIPVLERFQKQKQIHLLRLRALNSTQRTNELMDFGHFLHENMQIIHLACHAHNEDLLSESYLLVSENFSISMEDFHIQEFEIEHRPLVLLNACFTGTINPLHTSNWAILFWKYGARGVLATEFHVPDRFAASFIEELYNQLLSKKPIGEALLITRRHFWQQQKNPLGLGYALYSSPSIRIAS